MKKIFSVMLVVAMLLSLVTINVAAEGGIKVKFTTPDPIVANANEDQEVAVDFVVESNSGIISFAADFSFDETKLQLVKVEDKEILPGYNGYNGVDNVTKKLSWGDDLAKTDYTVTGVAATLTFKVLKTATPGDYTITLTPAGSGNIYDKDMEDVACTSENGMIKVIEESDVKSLATPATANVVYGGSLADALKDAKVTVNTETTATKKADIATLAVEWNVTGISTTPDKLDDTTKTITVPGTLVLPSGYTNTTNTAASATVTITPITDGTVAEAKGTVMVDAENGITEDTIKKALPVTLDVSKGDFKDTFAVEWTTVEGYADKNSGKDYVADNVITVKGTLTSPSANGLFTTSTTDVEGKVTVVPAEIKGGSISVNNPIDNGYATVSITVPASEIAKMPLDEEGDSDEVKAEKKAKRTIAISIAGTGDKSSETGVDEYVVSAEEIAAAKEADAKDLTVSLKSDKKMKDLGYSSSGTKTFTVDVTVGGTKLLNGDSKDAVSGEVKKASSSSATGINKGSSTTTTYAVTVVETTNGTVTVSPEKAAKDATVTITAAPAEGYRVKTVTVTKADGTNVPVDEDALTFTMPASAVKVAVEFEEGTDEPVNPTPADGKFADVADDFWAAKDIYTLKDAGIIGGKSETEFDPNGDVTRAEFAKMVVGLFGYKATSDAVNFEDCAADEWFTPYVAAGVEAGVIKGISDTEFAPNATITREDACTILGRALNKVAESNELKFTDADKVSEYAAPYVALLSELGYVNGYEDGSFLPQNNITRAEAAKIIAGIYNAKDTTVTEDNTEAVDNTEATVEGENTDADAEVDADAAEVTVDETETPVEEEMTEPEK